MDDTTFSASGSRVGRPEDRGVRRFACLKAGVEGRGKFLCCLVVSCNSYGLDHWASLEPGHGVWDGWYWVNSPVV